MGTKKETEYELATIKHIEWLLPSGTGGYASGTVSGINTRKYHGLLVSGFDSEGCRHMLLNTLEELVIIGDHRYFISAHAYAADAVYPRGFIHLRDYGVEGGEVWWKYSGFGDTELTITKRIRMLAGRDVVFVRYAFEHVPPNTQFQLYPLVTKRDIHALKTEAPYESERGDGHCIYSPFQLKRTQLLQGKWKGVRLSDPAAPEQLYFVADAGTFSLEPEWYHSFQYDLELQRGYAFLEDLFTPGKIQFLPQNKKKTLTIACASVAQTRDLSKELTKARFFPASVPAPVSAPVLGRWQQALHEQANHFFIEAGGHRQAIIAGYPWFGIWSRDMLIAFQGLLLEREELTAAKQLLITLSLQQRHGLLPNTLEQRDKRYAFVGDSSLLYVLAVYRYWQASGDGALVRRLWYVLESIIHRYFERTGEHPVMDTDGLIILEGDGSSAATWMDAVIDGRAVTPRYGKPVEIEALWFNALSAMRDMGAVEGLHLRFPRAVQTIAKTLESLIALVQESFRNQFWSADRRQLADVVYRGKANWQLRPNQLFAAGLPFPLLDPAETALMLETLEACLLTKAGLRTLAPGDPAYRGQYRGSQPERDLSYHQGTVWPWLLGLYGRARLHADQDIIKTAKQLRNYLESFFTYLDELHLAYIPEVFGGDDLQPGGTIQQAWNVSALLELFSILA